MGDVRFDRVFERVKNAKDRVQEIHSLTDDEVIAALGGATKEHDPLLANILATEAQNRAHRASAVATSIGEGVIAMNAQWKITLVNPAASRLLGWTSAELVGGDIHALIHPWCSQPEECHLGSLPPFDFFYQNDDALIMRKDGRTIRVAYTVTPMTSDTRVDGGIIVFRDSSERKRQEEKTGERQDRLEMVLQTLAEGVLIMDMTGRITYANSAAERILGRAARDIMQRTYYDPAWDFTTPSGDILPVTALPFPRVIETGVPIRDMELGVRRSDGTIVVLNVNTVPLPGPTGTPRAIVISFLDQRRAEGARKQA